MAKVMLVEDDNNLREIYGARLLAEGYEIVAAKDGEEALAMAVKEKPDLIISDIMMPKISGFDMLDILRSTPETKETKVIMMTALSQAEDKERAGKLGADRYLVKSQVTLEDVAKAAAEVLAEAGTPIASPQPAPAPAPAPAPEPTTAAVAPTQSPDSATAMSTPTPPVAPTPDPITTPTPTAIPVTSPAVTPAPESATVPAPGTPAPTVPSPTPTPAPITTPTPTAIPVTSPVATPQPAPAPAPEPTTAVPTPTQATATVPTPTTAPTINDQALADAIAAMSQATPVATEAPKTSVHTKVIEPINDMINTAPDLNELMAKENAKQISTPPVTNPQPTDTTSSADIAITPDGTIQPS